MPYDASAADPASLETLALDPELIVETITALRRRGVPGPEWGARFPGLWPLRTDC